MDLYKRNICICSAGDPLKDAFFEGLLEECKCMFTRAEAFKMHVWKLRLHIWIAEASGCIAAAHAATHVVSDLGAD